MEITIEITKYCPHNCDFCSTNADINQKHLDKKEIFEFLKKQKNITRINISGGEPLSHPYFYEILIYCNNLCEDVRVYTNAIKHLMFNSAILNKVEVSANVVIIPGQQINIPDVDNIHLLLPVAQGRLKTDYRNNITLSHNCKNCGGCDHILLQANGKIVDSPCKKDYE